MEGLLEYLKLPSAPGSTDVILPSVEASMRDQLEARIWADGALEEIREKETLARAILVRASSLSPSSLSFVRALHSTDIRVNRMAPWMAA